MKNPRTLEYIEAEQSQKNQEREKFLNTANDEIKSQFKAIDEAHKILSKHKIPYYLFTYLPLGYNRDIKGLWQWNNIMENSSFDATGKPINSELLVNMTQGLIYWIYNYYYENNFSPDDDVKEMWSKFVRLIYNSIDYERNRLNTKK